MPKEYVGFRGAIDEERAAHSFKDKVEVIAGKIILGYDMISTLLLYDLIYGEYGWDIYKIRSAIKLLHRLDLLIDVGWVGTWAVNKNWGSEKKIIHIESFDDIKRLPADVKYNFTKPKLPDSRPSPARTRAEVEADYFLSAKQEEKKPDETTALAIKKGDIIPTGEVKMGIYKYKKYIPRKKISTVPHELSEAEQKQILAEMKPGEVIKARTKPTAEDMNAVSAKTCRKKEEDARDFSDWCKSQKLTGIEKLALEVIVDQTGLLIHESCWEARADILISKNKSEIARFFGSDKKDAYMKARLIDTARAIVERFVKIQR